LTDCAAYPRLLQRPYRPAVERGNPRPALPPPGSAARENFADGKLHIADRTRKSDDCTDAHRGARDRRPHHRKSCGAVMKQQTVELVRALSAVTEHVPRVSAELLAEIGRASCRERVYISV